MDKGHEDFNDDEQEEENSPQENLLPKDFPQKPKPRNGPINVQMNDEVHLDPRTS